MINLSFPDGTVRQFESGVNGFEIAKFISKSLTRNAVAIEIDTCLHDLAEPIGQSASIRLITRDDPAALPLIRHSTAHIMAEAVQSLYPTTRVTIGPVIQDGFYYDFARDEPFTTDDLVAIENKMHQIINLDLPFTKEVWSREAARKLFSEKGETFKVELIDDLPEEQELKIYSQGSWFDLCRGPHMPSTGMVGHAFKLMKVAGAYWRGDSKKPMLTRIYGTAWATEEELSLHIARIEEAEKRDHRRLGRELDLFHFQEEGPGVIFWHPKGWLIFQELVAYMRRRISDSYNEVNSPQMLDKTLWEISGHWNSFRENMFKSQPAGSGEVDGGRVYAIKPMNCPGHIQIFKHALRSYRDLPFRLSEFGIVHRYEPSGALHGLMRVRGFTQDDAHIFCSEEQLAEECISVSDLILSIYADFGFEEDILVKLSTRPTERVGSDTAWDHAENVMRFVLEEIEKKAGGRVKVGINPGEGAFYGPKFEYTLRDAIGREWQCGTIQVDFNLPQRFGISFIDRDGQKKSPVMIHRAVCGSLERFIGILLEHYAGRMPFWIAPVQIVVATVTSDADEYAKFVYKSLSQAGLRCILDIDNEKISHKVREYSVLKTPVIAICGKQESQNNMINLRRLGESEQQVFPLDVAIDILRKEAIPPDLRRDTGSRSMPH